MEIEVNQPLIVRNLENIKSTNFQVAINLFKSSLGIGVLALPYCFNQSGILLSILFMIIISAATVYTVFIIVDLAEIKGLKETNFEELYVDYVGKWGFLFFQICMVINYFGIGVTYVIFFIDFFKNAFNTTGLLYSLFYSLLSLFIIIPLTFIRKLELFTKYSFLSNILMLAIFIIIMQYSIINIPNDNEVKMADILEIPDLLGVALFAFVSPGLVIPIRNSMKTKEAFKPTFFIVQLFVLFIYTGFSVICCFGLSKKQLTQNILKGFGHINEYYLIIQALYAFALVLSYPLQLSPLIEVLENIPKMKKFLEKNERNCFYKNIVRILISFLIFPCGIFISNFADFINLLGAFCFFTIQFIYPLWAYNKCHGKNLSQSIRLLNYLIILISLISLLISSYCSISSLMS